MSEAVSRQAREMPFIHVLLQSQHGWRYVMRRPGTLWDDICNSNVLHYFHLSFITELFILLVSMLQVFWYLQIYFQPRMGVTDSSFFSKHPPNNSFCSWTMLLTKVRQNKRQKNKPTNQPWKALPIYQLPVHKNPELIDVWVFMPGTMGQGNYTKPKF